MRILHQVEVLKVPLQDKAMYPLHAHLQQDRIVTQHQQEVPLLNPHQAELVVQVDRNI